MAIPTGPISIGVESVSQNQGTGIWTVLFTDGVGAEAGNWQDFVSLVESRLGEVNQDFVRWFALTRWIARNPNGANPNQIVGKTATLNLTVANNANIFSVT